MDKQRTSPFDGLISSKVQAPKISLQSIWRPRLAEKLSALRGSASIALVIAPPGFGKTSLLSSWIVRQKSLPSAWLTLDEMDGDLFRFMRYFLFALFKTDGNFLRCAKSLQPAMDIQEAITVIDEVLCEFEDTHNDFVLIVDNCQQLDERCPSQRILSYMVEHAPPSLRLVFMSRRMPRLGLLKPHLRDKLLVIDEDHLRFTLEETTDCLRREGLESYALAAQHTQALTGGWPAFVKLAASSIKASGDSTAPLENTRDFMGAVSQFVHEEIVGSLNERTHTFVLATSQIEPFCASLAKRVLGWSEHEVERVIGALIEERLFLARSPKEETEFWYVYHPLVSQSLKMRFYAQSEASPEQVLESASVWFEEHGKINLSARYASSIQNWKRIVGLIERHWKTMWMNDNLHMLYQWGKMLPRDLLAREPKACSVLSFASALYGDAEFTAFCESTALCHYTDESDSFYPQAIVFHMHVCNVQSRHDEAHRALEISLAHLDKLDYQFVHIARQTESLLSNDLNWLNYRNVILDLLPESLIKGSEIFISNNYKMLCLPEAFLGNFTKALEYADKGSLEPQKNQHPSGAAYLNIHFTRMSAAYHRGSFGEAELHLEKLESIPRSDYIPFFLALSMTYKAIFCYSKGNRDEAVKLISSAVDLSPYGLLMAAVPLDLILSFEDNGLFDFKGFIDCSCVGHEGSFSWHRLRFAYDVARGKQELFAELVSLEGAIEKDRRLDRIYANLLLSLSYEQAGKQPEAEKHLYQAVRLAEPEAIITPFCNDSTYYLPVLSRLLEAQGDERGNEREDEQGNEPFIQELLVKLSQIANGGTLLAKREEHAVLTPREKEILYQIVSGYKTNIIAERLGISRPTVRKHIANIYEKYGVHSRTQLLLCTL